MLILVFDPFHSSFFSEGCQNSTPNATVKTTAGSISFSSLAMMLLHHVTGNELNAKSSFDG